MGLKVWEEIGIGISRVRKLKNRKLVGVDGITSEIMKKVGKSTKKLCNKEFMNDILWNDWKTAVILS